MASVLRLALGKCSCSVSQPDPLRQAVCRALNERLNLLLERESSEIERLPSYNEVSETIEGQTVRFETIREPYPDAKAIIVVRAFFHTWSKPTWLSFSGVGHMFADGFILHNDGSKIVAADEDMWDFR